MAVGKFLKEHAVRVLALLVGVYLCFLMQLGDRSFAGHVLRILRTPEAEELGDEIAEKVVSLASGAKRRAELAFSSE
jgi:uncharacterized membrane protein (Fun14 family)